MKKIKTFFFLFVMFSFLFCQSVGLMENVEKKSKELLEEAERKVELIKELSKKKQEVIRLKKDNDKKKIFKEKKEKEIIKVEPVTGKSVNGDWRDKVAKDFYKDVEKIKNIILEGEDREEAYDFLSCFEEQQSWFDKIVTGTRNFFDPNYNAIMQKKQSIRQVVVAQEKAEEFLKKHIAKIDEKIETATIQKIKLIILYNLNSLIQDKIEKNDAQELKFVIDDDQIKEVVHRTFKMFEEREIDDVEKVEKSKIDDLEKKLDSKKEELRIQKEKSFKLEKNYKKKIGEIKRLKFDLNELQKKMKESRIRLKEGAEQRIKLHQQDKFRKKIEKKNRDNLELQLRLLDFGNDIKSLQKEVALWERKFQNEQKKIKEIEIKKLIDKSKKDLENTNRRILAKELELEAKK
ncbi:hypothetical protein KAT08_00350 [Candidatus Babeliales bacterium]|nr:hypothetical protein [Candidatus Babeliales bacterium]